MSHELRALERQNVVFWNVIAERVEEPRRDHLRASRQAFVAEGIEAQEIDLTLAVGHEHARIHPEGLDDEDLPGRAAGGRIRVARASLQLFDRQSACRMTVDIPITVHHFAEGIHSPGRNHATCGMPLAGFFQRVLELLEYFAQRARVDVGHRHGSGFDAEGIVGVETGPLRLRGADRRKQKNDRENCWKPHRGYHRLLKMSLNVQIILKPSRETAKSMRLTTAERARTRNPMPPL